LIGQDKHYSHAKYYYGLLLKIKKSGPKKDLHLTQSFDAFSLDEFGRRDQF
jgi:hypothetical protein